MDDWLTEALLRQCTRTILIWKRRSSATLIFPVNMGYVKFLVGCFSTKSPEHMLTLSQPCIGIARIKRWRRANMLKLNPPIEVLAVLLKDGNVCERAHMDELLS